MLVFSQIIDKSLLSRIIRLTTPNLNYFIIAGALILYSCIYIRMARTSSALFWKINCHVRTSIVEQ